MNSNQYNQQALFILLSLLPLSLLQASDNKEESDTAHTLLSISNHLNAADALISMSNKTPANDDFDIMVEREEGYTLVIDVTRDCWSYKKKDFYTAVDSVSSKRQSFFAFACYDKHEDKILWETGSCEYKQIIAKKADGLFGFLGALIVGRAVKEQLHQIPHIDYFAVCSFLAERAGLKRLGNSRLLIKNKAYLVESLHGNEDLAKRLITWIEHRKSFKTMGEIAIDILRTCRHGSGEQVKKQRPITRRSRPAACDRSSGPAACGHRYKTRSKNKCVI